MYTAALNTIGKKPETTQMPLTCEGVNKFWCICTMEYNSVIQMNKLLKNGTWINLHMEQKRTYTQNTDTGVGKRRLIPIINNARINSCVLHTHNYKTALPTPLRVYVYTYIL